MVCNKIEVLVVPKTGRSIFFEYELENEIQAKLTGNKELFSGVTTVSELLDRIGCGFRDAWPGDEEPADDYNFLLDMFSAFGDMDDYDYDDEDDEDEDDEEEKGSGNYEYDSFADKVKQQKLTNIRTVILMTDDQSEGDREYHWIRYDLERGTAATGSGEAVNNYSGGYYDPYDCVPRPKDYMESICGK